MSTLLPTQPRQPSAFLGDMPTLAPAAAGFTPPTKSSFPVGGIIISAVTNLDNFEAGWERCYAHTLDATLYPDLAARLGTGPSSFWGAAAAGFITVPDLQDRMPIFAGATFLIRNTGGEVNHTLTAAEMPVHDHGTQDTTSTSGGAAGALNMAVLTGNPASGLRTQAAGSGGAHNNMPPYVTLQPFLRVLP